jgi:signal transduction histidine kinase
MSGLDMLTQLRTLGDAIPVIIVAGQGSETIAVEALRRGASDYVVKSGDYAEFFPRVITQVVERDRMQRRNEHLESEHIRFARLAAIGEVATGIAHEIRNPLTIISGMATMMRDHASQLSLEEINKCANTIAENCRHLNSVLEEVLLSAQPAQQQEPLLLSEVLEETLSFMRFDPSFRHRMHIERDFETEGLVIGSRDQLKQVLINLFRNAAQAVHLAHKEKGLLRVGLQELAPVTAEGASGDCRAEVQISIEDNGDGIPRDVLPRIFESGFSTKRNHAEVEGNGLGLSISRRIIESHGGRIWAESRDPGFGALFCIALPSLQSHAKQP